MMYYNVTSRIFSKEPESFTMMYFKPSSHIQEEKKEERSKRKEGRERKEKGRILSHFIDSVLKPKIHSRVSALPPQM